MSHTQHEGHSAEGHSAEGHGAEGHGARSASAGAAVSGQAIAFSNTEPTRVGGKLAKLRRVLSRYTTPLLPDDYTVLLNPRWSARELRGTISRIEHQGTAVHLDIIPGWSVPTTFRAGQFIGIGVEINGRFVWRSYSLTNPPRNTKRFGASVLSITVRAVEQGVVSSHLYSGISAGTTIRLAAPAGEFFLTDPPAPALAFVAAGTGITPIISMLRGLEQRGQMSSTNIAVVYSARDEQDQLFAEELRGLAARYPQHVRLDLVLTGSKAQEQGTEDSLQNKEGSRRVTPDSIADYIPDIENRVVYACGPAAMLDAFEAWAAARNVELHTERFTLARRHEATGGKIHFASGKSIDADGATTILEASEQAGAQLPYGCRMGICHTCTRTLVAGEAADIRTGKQYEQGARLRTCVSVACGDITIH